MPEVGASLERTHPCVRSAALLPTEAFPEQVRQLDEESATVTAESRLELSGERIVSVVRKIVVVTYVDRSSRIRRVAEQKLAAGIRTERVVINPPAREDKPAELIGPVK